MSAPDSETLTAENISSAPEKQEEETSNSNVGAVNNNNVSSVPRSNTATSASAAAASGAGVKNLDVPEVSSDEEDAASPLSLKVDDFPMAISWENVNCRFGDRQVLKGFSGTALPGRLLAVCGRSGSGKTTHLKLIADRLRKTGDDREITGKLFVNEQEFTDKHRSLISFVPQDDILNGLSTTRETLTFAARVRKGNLPEEETEKMVHDSIKELGLKKVQDTIIGVPGLIAGLSGGERKRANVGCEQVNQPKVVLLDEPTTGLDTHTAEKIVALLRDLAHRGRTVICTIHQPTYDIMNLFDDLMLMAEGKIVYHGPMDEAVKYFAANGFGCPQDSTPTDFFMWHMEDEKDCPKLIAAWDRHLEKIENDNREREIPLPDSLLVPYNKTGKSKEETLAHLDEYFRGSDIPFHVQTIELFKRAFRNAMRNHMNIIATLLQAIIFGAYAGLLFQNIDNNTQGVADRFGLLFTMAVNTGFSGASAVINTFPAIKAVFLREQQAGAYSVGAFFLATSLADFPLQFIAIFIQCIIIYWSAALVATAAQFFVFFAVLVVAHQCSISVGLALSAGIDNPMIAGAMIPTVMTPPMLTGGYLASTDRLRPYWVWLEKWSFIKLPFTLLVHNEFYHIDNIWCDVAKFGSRYCAVQPQNGTQVLAQQELDSYEDSDWILWLTLILLMLFFRFIAYLALLKSAGAKE